MVKSGSHGMWSKHEDILLYPFEDVPPNKSSSGTEDAPFFRACGGAISRLHFNFDFVLKSGNTTSFDYSFVVIYCSTTPICGKFVLV